jgi:Uma2 family endonuclease
MAIDANPSDPDLPDIDERLAPPETRYIVLDGELVYVPPADGPHGTRHAKIAALIEAHTAADFQVAADMLTRTSKIDDVAPDVSVFPRAPDPRTGRRQLEQLAFEVVSTQSLRRASRIAAKLAGRGVRRVFAIDVERCRALEWSFELESWTVLDTSACIEDVALAAPLPLETLVSAARADDAMAQALLTKRNPVLEEARARDRAEGRVEGRAEGRAAGRAEALLAILETRGFSLDDAARATILAERDVSRVDRWVARAVTCTDLADLLAEP